MMINLCYEHRLDTQLEGISHNLRTSLAGTTDSPWHYIDSDGMTDSDHPDDHLRLPIPGMTLRLTNGSWLKAAPLAPGGLICDSLLLQSDRDSFSTLQHLVRQCELTVNPVCTMTSGQFHSRFRAASQGHAFQSDRARFRLLVMMPDASECNRDHSLVEHIHALLDTLAIDPRQTSVECVHKDTFGATTSHELLSTLKNRQPSYSRLGMSAVNSDRQALLTALSGNATLALCATPGSLADAFQFGLPVAALWSPAGILDTDAINSLCIDWVRQGCQGSKSMVAHQQQRHWIATLTENGSTVAAANKSSQLHYIVEKWLIHASSEPAPEITLQGPQAGRFRMDTPVTGTDLVLPSAFSPAATPNRLQKLRFSLDRKRRKFAKFRQSPTRFIEDSEVRWLRAIKYPRA